MQKFTINQIRNYILSQDSLGDVLHNLSEENIMNTPANSFKVGDKVRIIKNISEHEFKIGEVVELRFHNAGGDSDFIAKKSNDWWFVKKEEIEHIK